MRNTILEICKQIHRLLPDKRIAITRFVGNYEYGQIYVGELDREVKREPCNFSFAKRNFCVVYSQDPSKEQEPLRQDFERVCQTLEDNAPFLFDPRWYSTVFDVFETSLVLEFQVYERYERYSGDATLKMGDVELIYPSVIYEGDTPEPPEPPEPPVPRDDFAGEGITGTIRFWGDLTTVGNKMSGGEYVGTVYDSDLTSYSTLKGSESMSEDALETVYKIGGFMDI